MGFWISHGIHGLISLPAFCTAVAIQTKMLSQHGPAFAVRYFRALIPYINAKISTLERGEIMKTPDPFITTLNNDLIAEVKSFSRAAPSEKHPPGDKRKSNKWAPVVPYQVAPAKSTPIVETRPCLHHNPKMGVKCEKHKTGQCRFQHLDTNDPRQLKLFTDHQAVVQAKRKDKSKGRGKGRGRGK